MKISDLRTSIKLAICSMKKYESFSIKELLEKDVCEYEAAEDETIAWGCETTWAFMVFIK